MVLVDTEVGLNARQFLAVSVAKLLCGLFGIYCRVQKV